MSSVGRIRTQDLRRTLLDLNPEIVHFCGHGTDGSSSAAAGFRHLSATPETDDEGGIVLEDEVARAKLVTGIGDRAAMEFSKGFYDALGAGRPIEEAFKFGCNAIDLQRIPEHLTPVMKYRDC